MQPDVLDMLRDDVRTADVRRQRNRERFPFATEMLDMLKAGGIDARIVYAENAEGETIGKRDPGPWAEYLPYGVRRNASNSSPERPQGARTCLAIRPLRPGIGDDCGASCAVLEQTSFLTGESIGTPPDEYVRGFGGTPCEYRPTGDWA